MIFALVFGRLASCRSAGVGADGCLTGFYTLDICRVTTDEKIYRRIAYAINSFLLIIRSLVCVLVRVHEF
jgi:hypothetical protein